MKAISIRQPWAHLIVCGLKKYETRTWNTNHRGLTLIHASKKIDEDAMRNLQVLAWLKNMESLSAALNSSRSQITGAIIGLGVVNDSRPMTEDDQLGALCGIYPRAHVHVFTSAMGIVPIPCKGQLNYYNVDLEPSDLDFRTVGAPCDDD